MTVQSKILAALCGTVALIAPSAAWAAYDQTLVLTGPKADSIPASSISFTTTSGQSVEVVEEEFYDEVDDEEYTGLVIRFPGDNAEAGTLTYPGPDGQPVSVAVPAVPRGRNLQVDIGTGTVTTPMQPVALAPPSGLPGLEGLLRKPIFVGEGGFTQYDLPSSGFGVRDIGGNEQYVVESDDKIGGATYGIHFDLPVDKFLVGLRYSFGDGDTTDSGSVPAGSEPVGFVFPVESPEFGTGLGFGANGIDVDSRTKFEHELFQVKFGLPIGKPGSDSAFMPYAKINYLKTDLSQTATFTSPNFDFSQLNSELRYDLDVERWGLGLGAFYLHSLGGGFFGGVGGDATVYFDDRKLRGWQTTTLFNNSETLNFDDDDDKTSFGLNGEVLLHWVPPGQSTLGVGLFGRAEYMDDIGRIDTILSGNQILAGERVSIGSKSSTNFSFGLRVTLSY